MNRTLKMNILRSRLWLIAIFALLLLCMPNTALATQGDTGTDSGYDWVELADGTVKITGYTGSGGDITIPTTLSSKTVSRIGNQAFYQCNSLTSVTIQSGIIAIDSEAFYQCTALSSISLSDTVTEIGDNAFEGSGLTEITLPTSVKDIGEKAFFNCNALTTATVKGNVTIINERTFSECNLLESVELPNSVETIDSNAFAKCPVLNNFAFPTGLKTINTHAFAMCAALTSAHLPVGVTTLETAVFGGCSSLSSVKLPNTISSMGTHTFIICTALDGVTLPSGLTQLSGYTFYGCSSLTSITIPNDVTNIESHTFQHCTALKSVTLPDGLETISSSGFYDCTSLADITIPDGVKTIGNSAFVGCPFTEITLPSQLQTLEGCAFGFTQISEITLPSQLQFIGYWVFRDTPLSEITIPASVTTIEQGAFDLTTSLEKATILSTNAVFGTDVFTNTLIDNDGIYGYRGSTAEAYAAAHSYPFYPHCTVMFDSQGGSTVTDSQQWSSKTIDAPTDPTQTGYVFDGWYLTAECNGERVAFPYTVIDDATLYAKWLKICSVSFDSQGGSDVSNQTATEGNSIDAPTNPVRPGYEFNGWYLTATCDGERVTFPYTVADDETLYAKWRNQQEQRISINGALCDEDGKPLSGYTVELHSTTKTAVTDSEGKFTFTDVEIEDHTMIVKNTTGTTLRMVQLKIQQGDNFSWSKDGEEIIDIVVQEDTVSIEIDIIVSDIGVVTIHKITQNINPLTGDTSIELFIFFSAILGAAAYLVLLKVAKTRQ